MEWQAWLTLATLAGMVYAMTRELASPDVVLMTGLFALAGCGVLTPKETFAGFANESMATVGAVLVLSAALRNTGAVEATFGRIFGPIRSERSGLLRMMAPVAGASALLNNTTIVAMLTPVVIDWARRNRFSPARFLIPMDFATILGGVLTLLGTSTNLTVAALVIGADMPPLGLFEITPAGAAVCAAGLGYLIWLGPRLLNERKDPAQQLGERRREYTASMLVEPRSVLTGKSIEEAGLRHLPGLFLVEIDRGGRVLTPVASDETLREGDRLIFAGVVETIIDLQKIRGLIPATEQEEPIANGNGRRLTEAVISHSSPLVNQTIRDASFRTVYDAAVIAVHRNGERVPGKIGDIVLRPGDTLLLQTAPGFGRAHGDSADFYLVSEIPDSDPPRYDRARVSILVLLCMIAAATTELLPMSIASFLAVGALIATRCITATQARRSVEWQILIVIAAALGIGTAMEKTGAAEAIAGALVGPLGDFGPWACLAAIYLVTLLLTELISNNAAAALIFPIAMSTAAQVGASQRPFIIAICIAASCGFATPFGYQTHLIVYGPGGYRFQDFVKVGLPLDILCAIVALIVIPLVWPL